jgi:cell wall assembly regulator SMI1
LNPPATPEKLAMTEKALGAAFPPSVRESYLRHDGEVPRSGGMFGLWDWLTLDEVVQQTEEMRKIEEEFEFGDFEPGFMLPILMSGGGDLRYVEASKDRAETPVIEWWHEVPTRDVQYPSFEAMLEDFATRLENGEFTQPNGLTGLIDEKTG